MTLFVKFLAGLIIGIANVIPGVSGGRQMCIRDRYEDLLTLTSFNFKKIFVERKLLSFFVVGLLTGVLIFAKLITIAYERFPIYTNFFFTGIILGSIPMLYKLIKYSSTEKSTKIQCIKILLCLLSFALMLILFFAKKDVGTIQNKIITVDFKQSVILFFVGIIGSIAMLIPGLSGSFVLLILGYYSSVISAVSSFNIPLLFVFGLGVLFGLFLASKLLMYVLEKYAHIAYSAILGLVLGSLLQVIPLERQSPMGFFISGFFMLAGIGLILFFTQLRGKATA